MTATLATRTTSKAIDLGAFVNNKGSSPDGKAAGEGLARGETFASFFLPKGSFLHDGVSFTLPSSWDDVPADNVKCDGQTVHIPGTEALSLHLLAAGDDPRGGIHKENKVSITLLFGDDEVTLPLEIRNWYALNGQHKGAISTPYHFDKDGGKVDATSVIFHMPIRIPYARAGSKLTGIKLPAAGKFNALHLFAASYVPAVTVDSPSLRDKVAPGYVRATRRWEDLEGTKAQVIEVSVRNQLSLTQVGDAAAWVDSPVDVSLRGDGFKTVRPAVVRRLMPGDEMLVEVCVVPTGSSTVFGAAKLHVADLAIPVVIEGAPLVQDFTQWTASDAEQHSAPRWFTDAKFGIFIHWGLYSLPAWADEGKYAEWYWHWQHTAEQNGPGTYDHHLKTYGADFVYDDFIPMFKADKFDARQWVDLVAEAGAKYFVFTTKHHDGYALFDTKETTHRNSLLMGPKRDFTRELMEAADKFQPEIKKGTYYSMPEWFNPLYVPYGRDDGGLSFLGGPAHNAYKPDEIEEYNGHIDVGDYIEGLQVPQMEILANDYGTDLMWGDIGMANNSSPFVAKWYAAAAAANRQVAINNRLGIGGDFITPEMEQFATVQPHLWEACMSVDPYSFGYNERTRDDEYRSPTDLIHTLIDIAAKGGNFLLNIGPRGDGSVPDAVVRVLRDIGGWLAVNGRAVYGTQPYPLVPEVCTGEVDVRVLRSESALYILSLKAPSRKFDVTAPFPILPSDKVVLLAEGGDLPVPAVYENGTLSLDLSSVSNEVLDKGIAWVFEVK